MKKLAIALAVAVGASMSVATVPASADSIHIGPNGVRITDHDRDHHRRHHVQRCTWKKVVKYQHHRKIVKNVRVCR